MPMGKATDEWVFGNVEEGFKKADLIVDETFMTQLTGHQPLETRTAWLLAERRCSFLAVRRAPMQTVASALDRPDAGGQDHQRMHRRRLRQSDPGAIRWH
jgi:hypothetical protein